MAQPGMFAPRGEDWVPRELAALRKELNELRAANVFGLTGIKPKDGGTDLDGFVNINGPLTVNGASEINGTQVVNGPMTITGTLSLPAGIIDNDALSDPVIPVAYHTDVQNISITSGPNVEKLRIDVAVPAGYTRALVNLTATMNMLNNSGAVDSAYLGANINGVSPGWSSNATGAIGAEVSLSNTVVALVTGLAGGTFPLTAKASTDTGTWAAAGSASVLNLNATVQFLR